MKKVYKKLNLVITKIAVFGMFILLNCNNSNIHTTEKKIVRIAVSLTSPIKIENNVPISDTNTFYINYLEGYRIYEFPRHIVFEDSSKIIYDSIKYNFFVYDTSKKYGYLIKEIDSSLVTKVNADSILKSSGFEGGKGNLFKVNQKDFKRVTKYKDNVIEEVYISNDLSGSVDSTLIYFDKGLNDIPFSWSSILDKKYNSKLYKIEIYLNHKQPEKSVKLSEKFFVNTIAFKRDTQVNNQKVRNLFERYKLK